MNDMTVGMENLPNVFIDKIIIEPRDAELDIRVVVKMFDLDDDHSWRNRVEGLKVKCAFISDDRISSLNNGEISLYDISPGATINMSTDRGTRIKSCDEFRFNNLISGYESFTSIFEFTTVAPENLSVYVACFIDDLEFGIPMFDKFYGPMAAESIYIGGVPNELSGYFYNPETNEEYGGPVHQHSSGYMEGSVHREEPHSGLRYVTEENYKLIQGSDLIQLELTDEVFAGMVFEEQGLTLEGAETPGGPQSGQGNRNLADMLGGVDPDIANAPTSPPTEIY